MRNWVLSYFNLGIHSGTEASLAIRIRLLNVLNFSCLVISAVYAFINSGLHPVASLINVLTIVVNVGITGLLFAKKYIPAFFIFLLLSTGIGLSFVILFGKYIAADLLFCTGIAYSIAMFENRYRILFGVIVNLICYLLAIYFYENYTPVFANPKMDTRLFYYPNTVVFLITLFVLVYLLKTENQRYEKVLKARNRTLDELNHKNEVLLENILPASVARELKEKGEVKPKIYKNTTVMFTDFYQFTAKAERMSAIELVNDLDSYFRQFDRIIAKYGIEKLKTIGDAYMCVTGVPVERNTHAVDMIKAALEIRDELVEINKDRKALGKEVWDIRIGINSGNIVAGIIGETKFAFDIWGDAVNIASRMEMHGEPGKINISSSTYALVKDAVHCTHRGKVKAKGKGEIDMYFANSLIESPRQ
jgi:class 3 adenylate cyclase